MELSNQEKKRIMEVKFEKALKKVEESRETTDIKLKYYSLIHEVFDRNLVFSGEKFRIPDKIGMLIQADKVLCDLLDELGFGDIVDFYLFIKGSDKYFEE